MTYRLTWSFRSSDWSYRDSPAPKGRIPLRAAMSGHRISAGGELARVEHSYEFVDWAEGASDPSVFAVPVACGGTGLADGVSGGGASGSTGTDKGGGGGGGSAGKVAAAVIITMIFSFATAGVAAYLYVKRRAGTPTTSFGQGQPQGSLVERHDGSGAPATASQL